MPYTLRYDERVRKDVSRLDTAAWKRVQKAIEIKLQTQPDLFGKPLRHSLVGLRVLRIGAFRVVYAIKGREVRIFLIGDRKYIYEQAAKRI